MEEVESALLAAHHVAAATTNDALHAARRARDDPLKAAAAAAVAANAATAVAAAALNVAAAASAAHAAVAHLLPSAPADAVPAAATATTTAKAAVPAATSDDPAAAAQALGSPTNNSVRGVQGELPRTPLSNLGQAPSPLNTSPLKMSTPPGCRVNRPLAFRLHTEPPGRRARWVENDEPSSPCSVASEPPPVEARACMEPFAQGAACGSDARPAAGSAGLSDDGSPASTIVMRTPPSSPLASGGEGVVARRIRAFEGECAASAVVAERPRVRVMLEPTRAEECPDATCFASPAPARRDFEEMRAVFASPHGRTLMLGCSRVGAESGADGVTRYVATLHASGHEWTLSKRFSEWHSLHTALRRLVPAARSLRSFPPKRLHFGRSDAAPGGRLDPQLMRERAAGIETWLRQCLPLLPKAMWEHETEDAGALAECCVTYLCEPEAT